MLSSFARRSTAVFRPLRVPTTSTQKSNYTLGKVYDASNRLTLSKIVATVGPASENLPTLPAVADAGMRIMRINFSHATYEEADLRCNNLGKAVGMNHMGFTNHNFGRSNGRSNMRAIMLDTQGPEIRTGSFKDGAKNVELTMGEEVLVTTDETFRNAQTKERLWMSYKSLAETATPGTRILLDDGSIELLVKGHKKSATGTTELVCEVINSGTLGNKKGCNIPGRSVDLPALSDKDVRDLSWGVKTGVDFIAASFIRKASDVTDIRGTLQRLRGETFPDMSEEDLEELHPLALIISKIESTEALENFNDILAVSDAIMVARGDLGVEIPMETLANCQKEIVKRCNAAGKPVIVATEMLNSMQKNPRPTRAECLDVANAIFDGADCTMLSGESAQGKYPVQSVSTMQSIIHQAELEATAAAVEHQECHGRVSERKGASSSAGQSTRGATAFAAVQLAHSTPGVKAILVSCITPEILEQRSSVRELASELARFKPDVPILCVVPDHKTGRMLQLHRAVHPILIPPMQNSAVTAELSKALGDDQHKEGNGIEEGLNEDNHMGRVLARLTELNVLTTGDKIVMITSTNENNLDFSYLLDIP